MLTSVRKRNKSTAPVSSLVPQGIRLLYDRTADEERELNQISDEEMKSSSGESEDESKVFKLKERLRLKKKAEREKQRADKKVRRLLEKQRARSTDNSSSLVGFVVDEDSDATVSEEEEGPSFESSKAVVDSSDEERLLPFGQVDRRSQTSSDTESDDPVRLRAAKLEQIKNGVLSMNDLTAKEKDQMQKEFLRAKNLHIIKLQEEAKLAQQKQAAEDKARKCERREEARRQEKERQ